MRAVYQGPDPPSRGSITRAAETTHRAISPPARPPAMHRASRTTTAANQELRDGPQPCYDWPDTLHSYDNELVASGQTLLVTAVRLWGVLL